jgi:hypothetical protein
MTHHSPNVHFSEDELLRATVDLADLDPARQAHLKSCLHCQRQARDLTDRYRRLGQMARQMAPEPRKSFRVPADKAPVRRWHLKPVMALGVLGILIFAVTLWGPHFTRNSQSPTPMVAQQIENDDQLMDEVDTLVEDALPEEYQQVASLSGDRSVEDLDEFMDWMAPPPDEMDDTKQPATSDQQGRQGPLARSDTTVHTEEGTMA